MIREIYTRQADDPNYAGPILETTDEVEKLLAKIRMILGTKNGDIMGEYSFGIDLERLVFTTIKSQTDIEEQINDALNQYVNMNQNYTASAKVSFGHHKDGYDYAIVDIYLNDVRLQGFLID